MKVIYTEWGARVSVLNSYMVDTPLGPVSRARIYRCRREDGALRYYWREELRGL